MSLIQDCVGCLRGVGRSLRGLIRAWWDVDRVRISPRDGKLLGLAPPCVIRVRGQPYQILNRFESRESTDQSKVPVAQVRYECRGPQESASLVVRLVGLQQLSVIWAKSGKVSTLDEHQMKIFG